MNNKGFDQAQRDWDNMLPTEPTFTAKDSERIIERISSYIGCPKKSISWADQDNPPEGLMLLTLQNRRVIEFDHEDQKDLDAVSKTWNGYIFIDREMANPDRTPTNRLRLAGAYSASVNCKLPLIALLVKLAIAAEGDPLRPSAIY